MRNKRKIHKASRVRLGASPWSLEQRLFQIIWKFIWWVCCSWTPKPWNAWRLFVLKCFGARIFGRPFVHQNVRIQVPCNLTLHDRACLGDRANLYTLGEIEIGERSTIAQEAYLSTGTHDFSHPACPLVTAKISVGDDAFVAARAFIMPGIEIGEGAVIGAMSVVTKNIPPWVFAVGNPCTVIRQREKPHS